MINIWYNNSILKEEKKMKQEIKKRLLELSDTKYKNFHRKLCPGIDNIIGVRVPILRNYAKELANQYKIEKILEEIDDQYYEEILLQGMLIGMMKEDFESIKKQIEKFVIKINNWAICDVFCAGLKITKKYKKEMWEFLQTYLKTNHEFELRFGIVMILDFYIEKEYLKRNFEIFNQISSQDYYVQMAIAWAISICLIKFYKETMLYLETATLDKFTYNKALQKAIESYRMTKEQKEELKKRKK